MKNRVMKQPFHQDRGPGLIYDQLDDTRLQVLIVRVIKDRLQDAFQRFVLGVIFVTASCLGHFTLVTRFVPDRLSLLRPPALRFLLQHVRDQ